MTSSSFWCVETAKKDGRFFIVFAEYLKNNSTDFYQTYVIFRQYA